MLTTYMGLLYSGAPRSVANENVFDQSLINQCYNGSSFKTQVGNSSTNKQLEVQGLRL